MIRRLVVTAAVITAVSGLSIAAQQVAVPRPVTFQDLLAGSSDPTRWLMFGGEYGGYRHSRLTQITPQNVANLRLQWLFQSQLPATGRGWESTPLVLDGVIYLSLIHI